MGTLDSGIFGKNMETHVKPKLSQNIQFCSLLLRASFFQQICAVCTISVGKLRSSAIHHIQENGSWSPQ